MRFKVQLLRFIACCTKSSVVFFAFLITNCQLPVAVAQDIHFSQFHASPLNLNPAYTGFFNGDFRFSGIHRNQWKSVTVPYKTYSGAFDMNTAFPNSETNKIGAGIVFNNDRAGDSEFGILEGALCTSFIKNIGGDSVHFITGGIQLGFVQESINYAKLTFDNQFNGDAFDPNIGINETFSDDKFIYFDLSAGVSWLFRVNDRFNIGTGLALFHINKPQMSFMDDSQSKLNTKFSGNINSAIGLTENIFLLPGLLYSSQTTYRELNAGANVKFVLNKKPGRYTSLYAGAWLRVKDAFILSTGIDYNNLNIGFSYDINTSDLKRASNGKGAYEISLAYIIKKVKPPLIHPPCPVY
jgi:type IX secretion system PorP/SprF family membrane protein